MQKRRIIVSRLVLYTVLAIFSSFGLCRGDVFVHRDSGEQFHGYAWGKAVDGKTTVHTQEKGKVELKLAQWRIGYDRKGRHNKVIVMTLSDQVTRKIQTDALIDSISKAASEGPLFIILQIDTPGGRIDYTRKICGEISRLTYCPIYAYIVGDEFGGAISAGAAIAFACDKIYMKKNTVIGAAAPVVISSGQTKDLRKILGEDVGEKVSSVWRAYLASLAEHNDRPGLLAGAMVDSEVEVVEVTKDQKRYFIDPVDKAHDQELVHTWSKKGSLLTLTAEEAVKCSVADKVVESLVEVLVDLKVGDANIAVDDSFAKAGRRLNIVRQKYDKVSRGLDLKIKQMRETQSQFRAVKILGDIRKDYKSLIALARRYPDLKVSVNALEEQLNSAEAVYQELKVRR
ncbi:MAG: Clp protease/crotonase-like domain-containing protein [Planctomycetota bacterium]